MYTNPNTIKVILTGNKHDYKLNITNLYTHNLDFHHSNKIFETQDYIKRLVDNENAANSIFSDQGKIRREKGFFALLFDFVVQVFSIIYHFFNSIGKPDHL